MVSNLSPGMCEIAPKGNVTTLQHSSTGFITFLSEKWPAPA